MALDDGRPDGRVGGDGKTERRKAAAQGSGPLQSGGVGSRQGEQPFVDGSLPLDVVHVRIEKDGRSHAAVLDGPDERGGRAGIDDDVCLVELERIQYVGDGAARRCLGRNKGSTGRNPTGERVGLEARVGAGDVDARRAGRRTGCPCGTLQSARTVEWTKRGFYGLAEFEEDPRRLSRMKEKDEFAVGSRSRFGIQGVVACLPGTLERGSHVVDFEGQVVDGRAPPIEERGHGGGIVQAFQDLQLGGSSPDKMGPDGVFFDRLRPIGVISEEVRQYAEGVLHVFRGDADVFKTGHRFVDFG